MTLTTAQLLKIKDDIESTPQLRDQPLTSDGCFEIARLYNEAAEPNFFVWKTNAKVSDIFDSVCWGRYAPSDSPDETPVYTNRLLSAQTKLFSLQSMLQGRDLINASKDNVREALLELVTAIPTGANGALSSAGGIDGINVLTACIRQGTRIEKLLIDSMAPLGGVSAAVMGFEGPIGYQEIQIARGIN